MERRKFILTGCNACMALGSGMLVNMLSSCSTTLSVFNTSQNNMKVRIPESEIIKSDVKVINIKSFAYNVFLKKNRDNSYLALAMVCTHAGNPLVKTGNKLFCSLHGSEFDEAGNVLKGPAEKNLPQLPIIKNNGILEITLRDPTT
jgi:cytochrome b6-f complex iron-sulfur subunit